MNHLSSRHDRHYSAGGSGDTAKKLVSISVHSWLQRRSTLAPENLSLVKL